MYTKLGTGGSVPENECLTETWPPFFSEWHPFTISSAPEQAGYFTLHIRGVGQWTNRLYSYFEEEYRKQQSGNEEEQSGFDRLRG